MAALVDNTLVRFEVATDPPVQDELTKQKTNQHKRKQVTPSDYRRFLF